MAIIKRQIEVARRPRPAGEMREAALFAPVKAELEARGYTVYAEVPWPLRPASIDVVALAEGRWPVIVELKMGFTRRLLEQCSLALLATPYVYAAAPTMPRGSFLAWAEKIGIGVARVFSDGVEVLGKPKIGRGRWPHPSRVRNYRSRRVPSYRSRIVKACVESNGYYQSKVGGVPNHKGTGPAQSVWRAVRAYRTEHPAASWRELYEEIPNHYAHMESMRGAMRTVDQRRAADG